MYIDSGGVKEYCQDFGIEYTEKNIEEKLMYVLENYENISERINNYPFNSDLMCSEFLNLFEEMLEK